MSAHANAVRRAFESLQVQAREHGERPPTVAAVAARAGISRASMYRFHPGIVGKIRALHGRLEVTKQDQLRVKLQLLEAQLKSERQFSRALARACAELAAQKAAQEEQFEDERLSLQLKLERLETQLQGKRPVRVVDVR
jgi:AcrR family transcriptional regulator